MITLRLAILWAAVGGGTLYLAYMNKDSEAVPFVLSPEISMNLPVMAPVMAAFFLGALSVPILYSVDTVVGYFTSLRKSAEEKRRRRAVALYELGVERLMAGGLREAEKFFSKALALNPDHALSLLALGRMKREDGDLTGAIALHSKAKGLNEKSVAALLELAEDYYKAEQFVNAVSSLSQARKLAKDSLPAMERIRDVYARVGNFKEAVAAQKIALENLPMAREPEGRKILCGLMFEEAMEHLKKTRLDEAAAGMKDILRQDDQFIPAYLKLAEIYEKQGSPKNVRKTLEWGFKSTRSLIPLKALELYLRAKGEAGLVEIYRWALGLSPEDGAARLMLAGAYLEKGEVDNAQAELDQLKGPMAVSALRHMMEARINRAKNGDSSPMPSLEKAYERQVDEFFRFLCSGCGVVSGEYAGRCPQCGQWNTLKPLLV